MKHRVSDLGSWVVAAALLLVGPLAYAGSIDSDAGTRAFPSLKIGVGAEAVGMGEAGVAIADDAYSMYWNVAGLARVRRTQLGVMNNEWILDLRQNFGALALPIGSSSAFGVAVSFLDYGELIGRDENGTETGAFRPFDLTVAAGIGFSIGEHLALGVLGKYLRQEIDEASAEGVAADFGARYDIPDSELSLGLSVQHVGMSLEFETQSFSLPTTVRAGLGYRIADDKAAFVVDVVKPIDDKVRFGAGLAYTPAEVVTIRGGYHSKVGGNDLGTVSGLSAGFGLQFEGLAVDYAFVSLGDLGPANRVSLSAMF